MVNKPYCAFFLVFFLTGCLSQDVQENQPPSVPEVTIAPSNATTLDDLEV